MDAVHLFTLGGIPVRARLGYFGMLLLYGYQLMAAGVAIAAGFIVALTVSIVIHEFGHALVARRYKLAPNIVLHLWGGLCYHERARKDRHDVFILLGGPLLQISAGALAWLGMTLAQPGWMPPMSALWDPRLGIGFALAFFTWFVWISVFWGALNLIVPIWPLDGGQLFRMGMLRLIKPAVRAEKVVHVVGMLLSIAVVVYGVTSGSYFFAIMAGTWALENWRWFALGSPTPIRVRSELADKLIAEAHKLMQLGDWHEARRVAFQARDEKTVTDDQLTKICEILVVTSAELEDWHEALAWSPRAPRTAPAFVARLRALAGTGKANQARSELNASDAVRLEPAVRAKVDAWIAAKASP